MKNNVATLVSENAVEVTSMLNLYQGRLSLSHNRKDVKNPGVGSGNHNSNRVAKHKKECPQCGESFKNLRVHQLMKHEGKAAERGHKNLGTTRVHADHPDFIDVN